MFVSWAGRLSAAFGSSILAMQTRGKHGLKERVSLAGCRVVITVEASKLRDVHFPMPGVT